MSVWDVYINKQRSGYMPKTAVIGKELEASLLRNGMLQKELAIDAKTPNATISDHVQGRPVKSDKAIEYMEALEDNELTGAISFEYLGFLKAMDGKFAEVRSVNDLEVFQEMESAERKERKKRAQLLVAKSQVDVLSQMEKEDLRAYVDEFLDEIIVELTIVFSILKILNVSIQKAIKDRVPLWVKKKYMKG